MAVIDYEIENKVKDNFYETFSIRVDDCIALCHVVDEFEKFSLNLQDFIKKNGDSKLRKLSNAIYENEISKLRNKNLKQFYYDNYKVLSLINKYTYVSNFLLIYHKDGKFDEKYSLMLQYIKNNRNKIFNILNVLEHLKRLGFDSINFNEYLDFGAEIYSYNTRFTYSHYNYLDGDLVIYPNYDKSKIKYKSNRANYNMNLHRSINGISKYLSEITLNNLTFDLNNLPKELTYDATIGELLKLKKKNQEADEVIYNSVCLEYKLNELVPTINAIDNIIRGIKESENKAKALDLINSTKENILGIRTFLENYVQNTIENELVSKDLIDSERKLYKNYRDNLKIHWD